MFSLDSNLNNVIKTMFKSVLGVAEVRVFGSVLISDSPRDIDILVVAKSKIDMGAWSILKRKINVFRKSHISDLPLNILLLKEEEILDPGPVSHNILSKSVKVL